MPVTPCVWPIHYGQRCGKPAKAKDVPRSYGGEPMCLAPDGRLFDRGFRRRDDERADAEAVDLCGVHLRTTRERQARGVREAAARERNRERVAQRQFAVNLASMLFDVTGLSWSSVDDGRAVGLDLETAERLWRDRDARAKALEL